ncbi:MAG: hypothetical protein ABI569_00765 [Casimicrobiaceae bacterium]
MPVNRNLPPIFAWAVFATAGCGSTELRTVEEYDPGTTPQAQFAKGAALCDKQAEADEKVMGRGPLDPTHSTYNRMFDACMRASGWTRKPPK